jgi:hypothetical protein
LAAAAAEGRAHATAFSRLEQNGEDQKDADDDVNYCD